MIAPTTLVVPLYREAGRLGETGLALADHVGSWPSGSELIFVDDGSDDGTAEAVQMIVRARPAVRVRLLERDHRGKGAAVQAGLLEANCPLACFCDVDLSTPLAEVDRIISATAAAAACGPTLVIASRDTASAEITRHESPPREWLGKTFNRVVRRYLTPGVRDTQCGAKAAPTSAWNEILTFCRETGFAWDVEVIAFAIRLGIAVEEIGVEWAHDSRSRVRVLRDGAAMLRSLPRIQRRLKALGPKRETRFGGGVFAGEMAREQARADTQHWWFRSKARLVSDALKRSNPPIGDLVDLGAGAGGVTAMLSWPHAQKIAVEASPELAHAVRGRRGLRVLEADARSVPLGDRSAAVVCLLDVIEHLSDPQPVLLEALRLLQRDGRLVVTVPGHERLWSAADEVLGHALRYSRRQLKEVLSEAGFDVISCSHVFSWLVLPVWVRRRVLNSGGPELGLQPGSPFVDAAAGLLSRIESRLTAAISLPFGTSILCVAKWHDPHVR